MRAIHKHSLSIVAAVLSVAVLGLLSVVNELWLAGMLVAVWWLFLSWGAWLSPRPFRSLFTLLGTSISFLILFSLTEVPAVAFVLTVLAGLSFFFLWQWLHLDNEELLHFKYKIWRRTMVMLWVFNVYAWLSGVFGFHVFFPDIPFWLLAIGGAVFTAFVSVMIWTLYFSLPLKHFTVYWCIMVIMLFELLWVTELLPFGYFILSILVAWIWYLIQLFVRFHLTSKGIQWKKQRWFLVYNILLYNLFLYLVRWI